MSEVKTATEIYERAWYETWFDSPYYHLLYQHRDEDEAKTLINNLLPKLSLQPQAKVLDIACGRGRHAVYLNNKGFDVTGIDLSASSIAFAKSYENESLHFDVHNIHYPYKKDYFDAAFNFFTSFGYEECDEENYLVIQSAVTALKPGGYFVLDYLNNEHIMEENIKGEESVTSGLVKFTLQRKLTEHYIAKKIAVNDGEQWYYFSERVKRYSSVDLINFFNRAGLITSGLYGNYQLEPYNRKCSERLIIIGKKKMWYDQ